ncbi:TrbC family F-type conjugative pilus assembly protein [Desulfogranum marinum]|uniref:TrbC family F-type conjugative pilus assembly protein n=1 Tax=Desulfogranum marinum TaxID=453220 RepID=UPI0019658DCB|nr:TrbC family F-type conjugative pilus assembly protein [Desulfogranum marinum]MBM9514069.1 hypothetical protein [Desulfogranum marinum]
MDSIQEAILLYVLRLILFLCLFVTSAIASEPNLADSVKYVMEQARETGAAMSLPDNRYQEEGFQAAQASANQFHSAPFQEKLQCEQQRIREEVFPDALDEPPQSKEAVAGKLAETEKVYLFFSSAMPDTTVHSYLAALATINEPNLVMLMKGFVPGKRDQYLIQITKKNLSCRDQLQPENQHICERYEVPIKIQPSLFTKYEITQVPALVYERGDAAWKVTGDMALDYLLERINREVKSTSLAGLVNKLRGS